MFFNFPGFQPQFFANQSGDGNENHENEEHYPDGDFEDDGDYEDIEEMGQEDSEFPDKKLYEILGVDPAATEEEIKKAYKKNAVKYNLEKGGDHEYFKEITEAYEILSDPELRKIYDESGMKGINEKRHGGNDFDFFGQFFPGNASKNPGKPKKTRPILKELAISLEQAFQGKSVIYSNSREVLCGDCEGKGGKNVKMCEHCKSRGILNKQVMVGPGMYQFITVACENCQGQGSVCEESDLCGTCKGKKTVLQEKQLEIPVQRGVYSEFEIKVEAEGNQQPELLPGDLILRVKVQPHEIFRRNGADLFMDKEITLVEALCGTEFEVLLLSGESLAISTGNQVINPHETKVIKGKGMPFFGDPTKFGNLYVVFKVLFPKTHEISEEMLKELTKILPQDASEMMCQPDKSEVFMEEFNENEVNTNPEGGKASEEEQEFEDEQRRCGCTTQ